MHALLASMFVYRYLLLVPFAVIEGPILSIYCGFLLHEGTLTLVPTYIALMAGDLIGDIGWYGVGYYFGYRLFGRRFCLLRGIFLEMCTVKSRGYLVKCLLLRGSLRLFLLYLGLVSTLGGVLLTTYESLYHHSGLQ